VRTRKTSTENPPSPGTEAKRRPVSPAETGVGIVLLILMVAIGVAVFLQGRRFDPDVFAPAGQAVGDIASVPLDPGGEGWAAQGPVESFGAERLHEKINGADVLYLARDVRRLDFVSYVDASDPDRYVDLYVYDMGQPANARGVYMDQRPEGARPLELGDEAYEAGGSLFMLRGPYYSQILPADESSECAAAALAVAQALEAIHGDPGS
jgi:hypothetical protein